MRRVRASGARGLADVPVEVPQGRKMSAESTEVVAVMPRVRRRRRGPKPRQPFDKRTLLGRRVVELADAFRQRLGPDAVDPVTGSAVERAARLVAYSEVLSAKALRGLDVSPDDVIRAARAADFAVRRLNLHAKPQTPTPTLAEYLKQREVAP
jgi:hypothetical protein